MPSTNALLFPGQGSHAAGMDEPYRDHPLFGAESSCSDSTRSTAWTKARARSSPRCFSARWRMGRRATARTPLAAAGHSLGEYAALYAAGALDFEDARAARRRPRPGDGRRRRAQPGRHGRDARRRARRRLRAGAATRAVVANDNAPGQIVLSRRDATAIDEAVELARDGRRPRPQARRRRRLPLAAHGARRRRAASALDATRVARAGASPSSPTAARARSPTSGANSRENLLRPVRWRETLLALHARARPSSSSAGRARCSRAS